MTHKKNLIIYMPAFNEEQNIGATLASLPRHLDGIDEIQFLVINDGSTDNTKNIAESFGATVFSHPINRGVGAAFHSAVDQALYMGADIMVSIDSDGQFDAKNISNLIQPILENTADFCTGNRFHNEGNRPNFMSPIKYWGNKQIARLVSTIVGHPIRDVSCGFRAYSTEALLNLNLFGKFTYTQETIIDLTYKGFRLAEIPISVRYFSNRKSRVAGNISRYAINTFLIILRSYRDYQPLRFFGLTGIVIFLSGLALDIWLFIHYIQSGTFSPYKIFGVFSGFLNFLGILTIILALIADMFGRIRSNQEQMLYYQKKNYFDNLT